jgi:hypothetical protein
MIIITNALITGGGYFDPIDVEPGENTYIIDEKGYVLQGGGGKCTDEALRTIIKLAKKVPSVRIRFLKS